MPSDLVCFGNQVNQRFNEWTTRAFPLCWDNTWKRWKKEDRRSQLITCYIIEIFAKLILGIPTVFYALFLEFVNPESFQLHHVFMQFLFLVILLLSIVFDGIFYFYQDDIILGINTVYMVEEERGLVVASRNAIRNARHESGPQATILLVQAALKTDQAGVIVIVITFSLTLFCFLCAIIIGGANLDPFYLIFVFHGWSTGTSFTSYIFLTFVCFMLVCFCGMVTMVSLRTMAILLLNLGVTCNNLLISLLRREILAPTEIQFYFKYYIILSELKDFLVVISAGGLSLCFFLLVLGGNVAIIGLILGNPLVYVPAFFITFTFLLVLNLILALTCGINENALKILKIWRQQANCRRGTGYWRRVIEALPLISIPVGRIGIIDRDIKMNYFQGCLLYLVNILIVVKVAIE